MKSDNMEPDVFLMGGGGVFDMKIFALFLLL